MNFWILIHIRFINFQCSSKRCLLQSKFNTSYCPFELNLFNRNKMWTNQWKNRMTTVLGDSSHLSMTDWDSLMYKSVDWCRRTWQFYSLPLWTSFLYGLWKQSGNTVKVWPNCQACPEHVSVSITCILASFSLSINKSTKIPFKASQN